MNRTHITGKVLLLAQDSLIPIELGFDLSYQLLGSLLVCRLPDVRLDKFFPNKGSCDRVKLSILDACRLLELCIGLGVRRDQLRARSERGEVSTDSARLVQLKSVVLLLERTKGERGHA
jgi:hypothetical protein